MRLLTLAGATGIALLILLAVTGGSETGPAAAQHSQMPEGFTHDVVAAGLTGPTSFAFLPDGRVLVAEQSGVVRIIRDGAVRAQPFVDFSDQVNDFRERGLLSLAVDPEFAGNGFVYLLYAYENDPTDPEGEKTARLTRVTARGDAALPGSEVVILGREVADTCDRFPPGTDCLPSEWMGHSVGDLAFGADGTLFVSIGDASNWNVATPDALRAQDPDSLAGKILHVNREGKGLPTNPFWNGDPDAARSKIFAYGVRNAFRIAVKPGTDVVYAGDVGWSRTEEVDVVESGDNLGWPCYEGRRRQPAYETMTVCRQLYEQGLRAVRGPLLAWVQGPGALDGASVTGGKFQATGRFPVDLDGAYFYGDFIRGFIKSLQIDGNDRLISGPTDFVESVETPVDIEIGPDGALYYLSYTAGELRRIAYVGSEAAEDAGPRLFERPSLLRAGTNPHSVVAADLDGDGAPEIVTALAGDDAVAVLTGAEDRELRPATVFATGSRPKVVIVADLDADGVPDLASANQNGDSISVLLGNGDASFRSAVDYPACSHPHDLAASDLDRDGHLDVAVACYEGMLVGVLLGNGDGTFLSPVEYESGASPHSLVAEDLSGDGSVDLAVANTAGDDIGVLLGNGDGTFGSVTRYGVGDGPHSIRSGDLDGDGHLDLVTANERSDDVSVLLGTGDGTFEDAVAYPVGHVPKGVAVADVDGDGDDDVVAADTAGNYNDGPGNRGGDLVSVLLGDGRGALSPAETYLAGLTPFAVAVADVTGDGAPDLLTANWHGGTVSILPHR
jgi:glucose/arabinose dehydrogenase